MKRALAFTLLFFSLTPRQGTAVVDMKNASYTDTATDLLYPGHGGSFRIQRIYNSRSLFNGLFGFGWCSEFETILIKKDANKIAVRECGGGLEKEFSLSGTPQKNGYVFTSDAKRDDFIVYKNRSYIRYVANRAAQSFDHAGALTGLFQADKNHLRLSYGKNGVLSEITDSHGHKLKFTIDRLSGKVRRVEGPQRLAVQYMHRNEDLVLVKNAWNNTYKYSYDGLHNLLEIAYPDKTAKTLTYDQDRDWVLSFKGRNDCVEKYSYQPQADDPVNHYISTAKQFCGNRLLKQASFEFWHRVRADGKKYLARVRAEKDGARKEIFYDPTSGAPVRVVENDVSTAVSYNARGKIRELKTNRKSTIYDYAKDDRPARITELHYGKNRKIVKSLVTAVEYDRFKRLSSIRRSDGVELDLVYNEKNQIVRIASGRRKNLLLHYRSNEGRPWSIEVPGQGKVEVAYDSSGNISNVKKTDAGRVLASVRTTFMPYIDTADLLQASDRPANF